MVKGSIRTMEGKSVLITGGSGGIGKATAIGLAKLGAHVGIVGRNRNRVEEAASEIKAMNKNIKVDVFIADMSSLKEVRHLAVQVLNTYEKLDVLLNNVGGLWATHHVTVDGFERTFAMNHLAPFLLTNLLIDLLKKSSPARIITVASKGHLNGRIDFKDIQGEQKSFGEIAYSQSKIANVMFTYELARRLEGSGVTANVLHPGVVGTSIGDDDPMWYMPILRLLARNQAKAALTSIYLSSSPEVDNISGKYFVDCKPANSAEISYDKDTAVKLWQVSSNLAGL